MYTLVRNSPTNFMSMDSLFRITRSYKHYLIYFVLSLFAIKDKFMLLAFSPPECIYYRASRLTGFLIQNLRCNEGAPNVIHGYSQEAQGRPYNLLWDSR